MSKSPGKNASGFVRGIPGLYRGFVALLTETPIDGDLLAAAIERSTWEHAHVFRHETRRSGSSGYQPCDAGKARALIACGTAQAYWKDCGDGESLWYLVNAQTQKGPFDVGSFGSVAMAELEAIARTRADRRDLDDMLPPGGSMSRGREGRRL